MSPGELAVWAAEYVRALAMDLHSSAAARMAGAAVRSLSSPATQELIVGTGNAREDLAMLNQVLAPRSATADHHGCSDERCRRCYGEP